VTAVSVPDGAATASSVLDGAATASSVLGGAPGVVLPAAAGELAGVVAFAATVGVFTFFAPCAYPLLPGYVGYYASQDRADARGAAVRAAAAAGGALVTLAAVGAVVAQLGAPVARRLTHLEPVVGAGLVVLGALMFVGRAPELRVLLPARRASVTGFALFGAVYAVAAAGCVVPLVVGVVAQALTLGPAGASLALAAYALGVAAPLAVVTLLAAVGSDAFQSLGSRLGSLQRAAAVVMMLAGAWQVVRSLVFLGVL
jgi:cytochrome c-type biogenesis protein